jgi:aspartate/tyrosine/aromatic aminotransferase
VLADLLAKRGVVPLIDFAYQGFGDGLDQDAAGLRFMVAKAPEILVAVSCSKNFGAYRDRVGAAIVVARNPDEADAAVSRMGTIARTLYSMPPHNGAAVVAAILGDADLRGTWVAELDIMRKRMQSLRAGFADALRRATNSARFDRLAQGNSPLTKSCAADSVLSRSFGGNQRWRWGDRTGFKTG